jgi:Protein of unknown function (DUF1552)
MSKRLNRRMVLRGAAGFTLGMPFMYSLLGRTEQAQAQALSQPKQFVAFGTCDGGLWQEFMYPDSASLKDSLTAPAGHAVRRGVLSATVSGETAALSPVLSAKSSLLTPTLASKLNVLRGLDISFYMGHHAGGHLGNYGKSDQGDALPLLPTIDQVLANSENFYADAQGILERSLVLGRAGMSWEEQQGGVTTIAPNNDQAALFKSIFRPVTASEPSMAEKPIVDLVLEDYRRLRDSNRRLSAGDRVRLEEHLARLAELERKLNVVPAVTCGAIEAPVPAGSKRGNAAAQAAYVRVFNDIIVAAFACGTSRIATLLTGDATTEYSFSDYTGDWHGDIAHGAFDTSASQGDRDAKEQLLVAAGRTFFEGVFLDLASKLDAVQLGDGSTLLDHSLLQWTQEAGSETHTQIEMPIVTAGSAGKFFKTGQYVDYRQRTTQKQNGAPSPGVLHNQYLGNVLQAMGLAPSEFNVDGNGGYGRLHMGSATWYAGYNAYEDAAVSSLNDILPYLT